jgi:hypothetical protein
MSRETLLCGDDFVTLQALLKAEAKRLDEAIQKYEATLFFAGEKLEESSHLAGLKDAKAEMEDILTRCKYHECGAWRP